MSIAKHALEIGLAGAGLSGVAVLGDAVPLDLGLVELDGKTLLAILQTMVVLEVAYYIRRRMGGGGTSNGGTPSP